MYIINVNIPFKKDFKFAEYQNILFPLEIALKIAKETNKEDVESIYAKVTKHAS